MAPSVKCALRKCEGLSLGIPNTRGMKTWPNVNRSYPGIVWNALFILTETIFRNRIRGYFIFCFVYVLIIIVIRHLPPR